MSTFSTKPAEPAGCAPSVRSRATALAATAVLALCAFGGGAFAQTGEGVCGLVTNAYGPFDYRVDRDKLGVVDSNHFTSGVENLIRGTTGTLGQDLDFTLRAFPNHHRALMSMMRLGDKLKSNQPSGAQWTVECYFDRALRFRPDDVTARMIYSTFLIKARRESEAVQHLERAAMAARDDPFTHYNIGLVYLDMKNYDKALEQAHKAYGMGFEKPGLREQLKAAGKWSEAPAGGPAPSGDAAPATRQDTAKPAS